MEKRVFLIVLLGVWSTAPDIAFVVQNRLVEVLDYEYSVQDCVLRGRTEPLLLPYPIG